MSDIDPTITLGELVSRRAARVGLIERLGLDYCCGGAETLGEACKRRGLDPHTLCEVIEALDRGEEHDLAGAEDSAENRDWREAGVAELCEHIVSVHHARLRNDLPQIEELLASVMRVHGPTHLELRELPHVFSRLRDGFLSHLDTEEQQLFPACRAIEAGAVGTEVEEQMLASHEDEHRDVGEALAKLHELTGGYDTSHAFCRTHHRLLQSLHALEVDTHRHIHEENNILFARVRALAAAVKEPV